MAKLRTTQQDERARLTNYEKEDWDAASFFDPEEWNMSFKKEWNQFWRERKRYERSLDATCAIRKISYLNVELSG